MATGLIVDRLTVNASSGSGMMRNRATVSSAAINRRRHCALRLHLEVRSETGEVGSFTLDPQTALFNRDRTILDPVVTGARPTRNSAYLVFDTLYGIDTEWNAQPQMVEGHTVEEDGLTWTLKLRDGLRFHDNEPVLARDVVAGSRRASSLRTR